MAAELPEDGPARVGGVDLPEGRWLWPGPEVHFLAARPVAGDAVLWATRSAVAEPGLVWRDLDRMCGPGLVPVLLEGLHGNPGRPWDTGEFQPPEVPVVDTLAAESVLRDMWAGGIPRNEHLDEVRAILDPFGLEWPGLADPQPASAGPADLETALGAQEPARIGLVRARRAADIPAVVGWAGALNWVQRPDDISAVLRSWEDRFGAKLLGLGFDTMKLFVERPPISLAGALGVAAEQFALCSDVVYQGAGSVRELAESLIGANIWSFWWDWSTSWGDWSSGPSPGSAAPEWPA